MGSSVNFYGQFNISHNDIVNFLSDRVDVIAYPSCVIVGKTGKERVEVITRLIEKIQEKYQQYAPCSKQDASKIINVSMDVLKRLRRNPNKNDMSIRVENMAALRFCILTNFVKTDKDLEQWPELFPPETFKNMCSYMENKQAALFQNGVLLPEANQRLPSFGQILPQDNQLPSFDQILPSVNPLFPVNQLPSFNQILLSLNQVLPPVDPVLPPANKMKINFLLNSTPANN
jgi:hypothetical protein